MPRREKQQLDRPYKVARQEVDVHVSESQHARQPPDGGADADGVERGKQLKEFPPLPAEKGRRAGVQSA